MGYTLPLTCQQLCVITLVGLFIIGNAILFPIGYNMNPMPNGFFGWLFIGCAIVFGLIMFIVYVIDNQLIRCKCDK